MSIKSAKPSNHLTLCHPLLLPSVFPSIRVFSNELSLCVRWPKYWSFSFSISLPSEYSGLISFRIDWFDLLAVPGTLKSLQQYSWKAVFQSSASFMVELYALHYRKNYYWKTCLMMYLLSFPVASCWRSSCKVPTVPWKALDDVPTPLPSLLKAETFATTLLWFSHVGLAVTK